MSTADALRLISCRLIFSNGISCKIRFAIFFYKSFADIVLLDDIWLPGCRQHRFQVCFANNSRFNDLMLIAYCCHVTQTCGCIFTFEFMLKWLIQKPTHITTQKHEHQDTTDIKKQQQCLEKKVASSTRRHRED